ncbi:hypothetical protein GCM10010470_64810 [Saccharopolyspora taberi]|uniref:Uncharacterized protein n=1 Tax=Saccharopolyspora taberi TaxID=60895 RepID=A0ABN3VMS9_9PSEU
MPVDLVDRRPGRLHGVGDTVQLQQRKERFLRVHDQDATGHRARPDARAEWDVCHSDGSGALRNALISDSRQKLV